MKRSTLPMPVLTAMHPGNPHGLRFAEGDGGDTGGGDGTDPAANTQGGDSGPQVNQHGYPDDTPVAEMTAEQQAAYWKYHARKHESAAKSREDYDDIKAERDRLKQATLTPDERAIEEAKQAAAEAARTEERARFARQMVSTKVEAALSRRGLAEERIAALVGPLDHNYFLTGDGEVDADKVSSYASGFGQGGQQWPDTGQGKRGDNNPARGVDAGKELFASRRKK